MVAAKMRPSLDYGRSFDRTSLPKLVQKLIRKVEGTTSQPLPNQTKGISFKSAVRNHFLDYPHGSGAIDSKYFTYGATKLLIDDTTSVLSLHGIRDYTNLSA